MSCGTKFLPKKGRCLETAINRKTVVDTVAAFLYATSIINDNEEITDISFGDMSKGVIPIQIHFKGGTSKK